MSSRFGLLGEKLGHSYSPRVHSMLGDYDYRLIELAPHELEPFMRSFELDGANVTIPYKKAVMPFCAELSQAARAIGCVNTIVRRDNGLYGDNTDLAGFVYMLAKAGIKPQGKALVLGSGGASLTACAALRQMGAQVVVISRSGENNYDNIDIHSDARLIVNTTPVGMYPNNGKSPVNLSSFTLCEGVVDVIYNPARTELLMQARELGIPYAGGLSMLVAQAKYAAEQFLGEKIDDARIAEIENVLARESANIILIGMPGSGKSTVGKLAADMLGREFIDADECIVRAAGKSIAEIFAQGGESEFRALETQVLSELGKLSGKVIATGGGCVTRDENYRLLAQNGVIFWIRRDIENLDREGRPLSQSGSLEQMYSLRRPMYERFADCALDNNGNAQDTARELIDIYRKGAER